MSSITTLPNPYYWAGNEPDLLAAFQFNVAGANSTKYAIVSTETHHP